MQLTLEEIRMMASAEVKMDTGEIKHVLHEGRRWAVLDEIMKHFHLKNGQTVCNELLHEIMKANHLNCLQRLERQEPQ